MDDQNNLQSTTNDDNSVIPSEAEGSLHVGRDDDQWKLQAAEYLAGWKRAQADYQNLKKEVERDRIEYAKYANERLLQDLLPAFDQFALALKHLPTIQDLPEDQSKIWGNWFTGLKAVQSLWEQTASSMGLERIPTDGAFNPQLHEAAGEEEAADRPSHDILRVVQDGWRFHGKVLRPARVIVAK